ncbi:hypothetical protein BDW74DRAFT_187782 [Aspergillus multicolor]|uniref:uncharacterized protein n=1 Tax=Aspergillus multicolor TaxID=41759 RepID=UPI003CCCADFB
MESLTQSVLWMQTLFNVQRTYLQGLATSQDCHPYFAPYLISSDIIYSTLMYLTKVKMDLFPCSKPTATDSLRYRQLIGQTFLVGIRLLVLRGEPMSSETKFRLERAMRSAWEHPDLSKSESFLINDLLPKAIANIGSTDLFHAQQTLLKSSKAYVPIFSSGIYPFPGAPDTLVTDLLTALMRKQDDQLTSFYLLFDLLWAAESALIHCHIDRRRILQEQGHNSDDGIKVDEAFNQTQDNRKKLARTILAAYDDEFDTPSLQVLATVILSESAGEQAPLQTRRIRDSWGKLSPLRDSTDSALSLLMRWLVNRRVRLWGCNGELEGFSHDYQKHLTQWLHSSSSQATSHPTQVRKGNNSAVYVVNCPAVHPVPEALLEEQLKSSDKKAYESRFLTMNTMCPLCPGNVKIQHARMIEPLDQVPDALHNTGSESSGHYSLPDSTSRDTTSRSSSRTNSTDQLSRVDSVDGLRSPVSPISSSISFFKLSSKSHSPTTSDITNPFMARPRTGQSQDKQLIRSLSKDLKSVTLSLTGTTSLFRKGSSKARNLTRQPKFGFSASGQSLLIWDVGGGSVMRFEINSMDGRKSRGHRYDAPGVQHAAAGSKRAIPEAYLTVETLQPSSPITCMVMSRDDRYVAFTLEDEVRVFEIDTTEIRQVRFGDKTDYYTIENALEADVNDSHETVAQNEKRAGAVIARRLQFSVDGRRFIVATHLGNQYVNVDVWNCNEQQWKLEPGGSKSFKLPPWSTDDGDITCVFYDSFNETVVLTAFLERAYPISFSLSSEAFTNDSVSPRIVHAAQSPSGSRFVLANGMKQLYLCDSTTSGSLIPTKMKKAISKISPSAFRPGQLAFSFPGENEVFAFWAREGKLMLRTISLHASGETVSDYDLRPEFDRLVIERPVVTDIHRPRHQPSSLSRQIDSEIEGIQTQPVSRPNLPELPAT